MADIQKYLDDIMEARYGEEVRGSIHDAIEKINNVSDEAVNSANEAVERAETFIGAAEDARQAAGEARTAAGNANSAASRANQAATTIDESIDQGIDERLEDTLAAAEEAKEAARRANKAAENAGGGLTTESYRVLSIDTFTETVAATNFEIKVGETKLLTIENIVYKFREHIKRTHSADFDLDLVNYFVILDVTRTGGYVDGSPMVIERANNYGIFVNTDYDPNSGFHDGYDFYVYNRTKNIQKIDFKITFMSVQKYTTNTGGISLADLIDEAQSAIKDSQKATQNANDAVKSVETVISASETATNAANQAANTANKAIEDLDTSVENVNEALRAATDANTKATQALSDAEEAISSANDAAQSAMSSSDLAIGSAGAANEAAEEALRAAEEASKIVDQAASKEYVDQQINEIEIGGRNLLRKTNNADALTSKEWIQTGSAVKSVTLESADGKFGAGINYMFHVQHDGVGTAAGIWQENIDLIEGNEYVVSAYVIHNTPDLKEFTITLGGSGTPRFFSTSLLNKREYNGYVRYSLVFNPIESDFDKNGKFAIAFITNSKNAEFSISGMKLELGNKPTDWSPSPDDSSSTPEPTSGGEIGGYQLLKGSNNKESFVKTYATNNEWENKIFSVDYTGRPSSDIEPTIDNISDCPNPDVNVGITYNVRDDYRGYWFSVNQTGIPFKLNQKYTMSYYFRSNKLSATASLAVNLFEKSNLSNRIENHYQEFKPKEINKWEKFCFTFEFTTDSDLEKTFQVNFGAIDSSEGGKFEMCGFKLELGDTATDWSPNKDDLSSGSSINGYYLFRNTIKLSEQTAILRTSESIADWTTLTASGSGNTITFYTEDIFFMTMDDTDLSDTTKYKLVPVMLTITNLTMKTNRFIPVPYNNTFVKVNKKSTNMYSLNIYLLNDTGSTIDMSTHGNDDYRIFGEILIFRKF